jgi:hypothetical protein
MFVPNQMVKCTAKRLFDYSITTMEEEKSWSRMEITVEKAAREKLRGKQQIGVKSLIEEMC